MATPAPETLELFGDSEQLPDTVEFVGNSDKSMQHRPYRIDLTGQRFGHLTVISEAKRRDKRRYWRCICDCGNVTVVRQSSLTKAENPTGSCGRYCKSKSSCITAPASTAPAKKTDTNTIRKAFNAAYCQRCIYRRKLAADTICDYLGITGHYRPRNQEQFCKAFEEGDPLPPKKSCLSAIEMETYLVLKGDPYL